MRFVLIPINYDGASTEISENIDDGAGFVLIPINYDGASTDKVWGHVRC